jgi:hypothetical protein
MGCDLAPDSRPIESFSPRSMNKVILSFVSINCFFCMWGEDWLKSDCFMPGCLGGGPAKIERTGVTLLPVLPVLPTH